MNRNLMVTSEAWMRCLYGALAVSLSCTLIAAAQLPQATTILRRADLVRNPYLGTAFDIDLSVAARTTGRQLRSSRYILLTHRNDRTLILMQQPDRTAPGAMLIADDTYWLLLPQAERLVELAFRQVVAGDLSQAGFLRVNLRTRYQARYDGEETLGDLPCWRLDLQPKSESDPFGRVRYWVAKDGYLPNRIEYYDDSGQLLKTVRFTRYQETGAGLRPARIEIEDTRRPDEITTLTLGRPTGVQTSKLDFDLEDLFALREAARRLAIESQAPLSGRQLVEALLEASAHRH